MLATSQKLLHRARSMRRLHNHSQSSDDESMNMPQMPPSPTQISSPIGPMAIPMPMPMPPTQRPRTSGIPVTDVDHSIHMNDPIHYRQASTCSHVSRASSSWSSNASTMSSTTSSRNAGLEWDPLRLHPVPCMPMPVVRASPQYYDAGRSFYYEADAPMATTSTPHGFDFGFESARPSTASRRRAVRQTIADIHLASSTDDDEGFESLQGLSAPPPRHHRLRAHQSEANLQQTMRDLQLLGESGVLDRPSTPPMPDLPAGESEPPSPVTPRTQPHAATESERYFKRGDWKRRGIVFSAFDD